MGVIHALDQIHGLDIIQTYPLAGVKSIRQVVFSEEEEELELEDLELEDDDEDELLELDECEELELDEGAGVGTCNQKAFHLGWRTLVWNCNRLELPQQ
jgi:hypothetical protein